MIIIEANSNHLLNYHQIYNQISNEGLYFIDQQSIPFETFSSHYLSCLEKSHLHYFALVNNLIVGWVEVDPYIKKLGIGIIKEFRGIGIGSLLMEHCLSQCNKLNISPISLTVLFRNKVAISLYTKYGFTVVSKKSVISFSNKVVTILDMIKL